MLTSLPCELCFNDLRDAERRSQKNEHRTAPALCTAAIKSGWARSPLSKLTLDSKEWAITDHARQLRTHILSNARQNDKDIGVPMTDLTNKQTLDHLTKPHVLTQRLRVFRSLRDEFARNPDVNVEKLFHDAWQWRLLQAGSLWKPDARNDDDVRLIVSTGPYIVRYLKVLPVVFQEEHLFQIPKDNPNILCTIRFDSTCGELSVIIGRPSEEHGLLLQPEAWLAPKRFLLTHTILGVPAGFVAQYCKLCGIGSQRSNHKERVRLLLESEHYPAEYIEETLDALPNRTRQSKKAECPDEDRYTMGKKTKYLSAYAKNPWPPINF